MDVITDGLAYQSTTIQSIHKQVDQYIFEYKHQMA